MLALLSCLQLTDGSQHRLEGEVAFRTSGGSYRRPGVPQRLVVCLQKADVFGGCRDPRRNRLL